LVRQPICVFDRGSRVTEFSESFALLWATRYGMRPAEGVGLQAMFPSPAQEGERSGWQDRLARAFRGEQFTRDLQVREGNAVRTYDVTYTPVRRGPEVVSVIVTMEDVTRALAAERALVASEEGLHFHRHQASVTVPSWPDGYRDRTVCATWVERLLDCWSSSGASTGDTRAAARGHADAVPL
jgi:hypothetical protein